MSNFASEFYTFLRNRKYKVNKSKDTLILEIRKSILWSEYIELNILERPDDITRIHIKFSSGKGYILWVYGKACMNLADSLNIFLLDINLGINTYETILNILKYLCGISKMLITEVAVLFKATDKTKNNPGYKDRQTLEFGTHQHRVNNYPPLDYYGEKVGYVVTIKDRSNGIRHFVVDNNTAKNYLDKYIDMEYFNVKYVGQYFNTHNNITEKQLKQLMNS